MIYPAEISKIKFKIVYTGRSTKRFTHNQEYEVTYAYGVERGYKASSLDHLIMSDGYRILPYEEKKFWRWVEGYVTMFKILYGRKHLIVNLVYNNNPLFSMLPKDSQQGKYFPVPIVYE